MSLLTVICRYLFDTRQGPQPGLPEQATSSDPYLSELLELYPPNIYSGGKNIQLPNGRTRMWSFGVNVKGRVLLVQGLSIPSVSISLLCDEYC